MLTTTSGGRKHARFDLRAFIPILSCCRALFCFVWFVSIVVFDVVMVACVCDQVKADQPSREIQRVYNEVEIDIITNMLQKLWLEDFFKFTQALGGATAEVMKELLGM